MSRFAADLRRTAEAQLHSAGDVHGVSVKPSQLLALIEVNDAATAFLGTTSVFQQRKAAREAFTRLAVAAFWPNDPRFTTKGAK